jgi:hypothetical protein
VLLTLWIAKGDDLHLLLRGHLWPEVGQWIAAAALLGLGLYCHMEYLDNLAEAFATGGTTHKDGESLVIPNLFDPNIERLRDAQFWLLIAAALAAANFGGSAHADLAIGAPGEQVGDQRSAGIVHVFYGTAEGLTHVGHQSWSQLTPGMTGLAEENDQFGRALLASGR